MPSIEEIRGLGEFLKPYQFELVMSDLPSGIGVTSEELRLRCTATQIPGSNLGVVDVALGGQTVREAGRRQFSGTWNVTLIEGTSTRIIRALSRWQDICFNPATGVQGSLVQYKKSAKVLQYDNAGNFQLERRIVGIWPSSVPDVDMAQSDEAVSLNVTFTYDYWTDDVV